MTGHSAIEIANEFLERRDETTWPSQMWLQKLVYIAHGWNLAVNKEPLVSDDVEAWDGGPVFRSLWDYIRDYGYDRKSGLLVDPFQKRPLRAKLSSREKAVIDHVWGKYRKFSGKELSQMTHRPGTPWTKTYLQEGRDRSIPNSRIRKHYVELALAGRQND